MRRLLGPTVRVSLLALATQFLTLLIQVTVASAFGARAEFDAYLAALTLPAYLNAVLLGGLSYVFIPIFVTHRSRGDEDGAWRLASSTLVLYGVLLTVVSVLGVVFARPLLRLTVPGLPENSLVLSAHMAAILWPTVLLGGLSSLLTGIHHAHDRFSWPALTPLAGGLATLGVLLLFRQRGIVVMAVAMLAGAAVQCGLLLPSTVARLRWPRAVFSPEVWAMLRLLLPLIAGAAFSQAALPVERYVASDLSPGTISHLGYANRITMLLSVFLSGGIAVTLFPRMARQSAADDPAALSDSLLFGLRAIWVVAAPAITLGMVAATPLIAVALERGAFGPADTAAVGAILPWYLVCAIAMTGGNVTARVFYALRDTRTVSLLAVAEVILYATVVQFACRHFGVIGIAASMAFYWNISFTAQCVLLWRRLRPAGLAVFGLGVLRVALSATAAAAIARVTISIVGGGAVLTLAGVGLTGILAYLGALYLTRAQEWTWLATAVSPVIAAASRRLGWSRGA